MSAFEEEKQSSNRENYYSARLSGRYKIAPRNEGISNSQFREHPGIVFMKGNSLENGEADPRSKALHKDAGSSEFVQDLVELSSKYISNSYRSANRTRADEIVQNDYKSSVQNQFEIESLDGPSISNSRKATLSNKLPAYRELSKVSVSSVYRKSRVDDSALRNSELDMVFEGGPVNSSRNETSLSRSLVKTNPNEAYNHDKQKQLLEQLNSVIEMPEENKESPQKNVKEILDRPKNNVMLRELDELNQSSSALVNEGNSRLFNQLNNKKLNESNISIVEEEKVSQTINNPIVEEEKSNKKGNMENEEVENAIVVDQNNKEPPKQDEIKVGEDASEKCCRICLEEEETSSTGILMRPCQCQGTMGLIHEECLKTWLVSKGMETGDASCELCKTKFRIICKEKLRFYPKMACQEGIGSLLSCGCLSLIIMGLLVVIILIAVNWQNTDASSQNLVQQNSDSFKIAVVVACLFIGGILGVLVFISCKEAFFIWEISHWKILAWTPEWQREQDELMAQQNQEDQEEQPRNQNARHERRRIFAANLRTVANLRPQADQVEAGSNPTDPSDSDSQQQYARDRSGESVGMGNQASQDVLSRSVSSDQQNMFFNESAVFRLDRTHDELIHNRVEESKSSQPIPQRDFQEGQGYANEHNVVGSSNQKRLINPQNQSQVTGNRNILLPQEEKIPENKEPISLSHSMGKESKGSLSKNHSQKSLEGSSSNLKGTNSSKSGNMQNYQEISPIFIQSSSKNKDQQLTLEVRVDPRRRDVVIENVIGGSRVN